MGMSGPSGEKLRKAEQQIAWVLAHPGMSPWLKGALRTAHDQNPVHLLNDLEILCLLLRSKSQAVIDQGQRYSRNSS
jgi:hypothetical protein